jgi:hypothetical protein
MFMRTALVSLIMLAGIVQNRTAVVNMVVAIASAYRINCRSLRQSILSAGTGGGGEKAA